jgi:hypothetical protein
MIPKDTSLSLKVRKSWQNSGIEITPSTDDNKDPNEYQWCPEVVELMEEYGQAPADFIVTDNDSEGEVDIQDSDGDYFPTHVTENTHYATKQYRKNYLYSKSRFELAQSRSPLLIRLTLVQSLRMSLMALRMSSTAPRASDRPSISTI